MRQRTYLFHHRLCHCTDHLSGSVIYIVLLVGYKRQISLYRHPYYCKLCITQQNIKPNVRKIAKDIVQNNKHSPIWNNIVNYHVACHGWQVAFFGLHRLRGVIVRFPLTWLSHVQLSTEAVIAGGDRKHGLHANPKYCATPHPFLISPRAILNNCALTCHARMTQFFLKNSTIVTTHGEQSSPQNDTLLRFPLPIMALALSMVPKLTLIRQETLLYWS